MRELERNRANETELSTLAVIGAGRVGRSLAAAAADADYRVELAGRGEAAEAASSSEMALLCVPDSEIGAACASLGGASPLPRLVGHTSGATGLDALAGARAAGAITFSLHPLQTIADAATPLAGVPAAVSGESEEAERFAAALAERLGMRPFTVPEESRAAYHAAACIASNFLVALEESAAGLLADCGVGDARELLAPLVLRTASNWAERGNEALTGPIARGDEETVERHLAALGERAPELLELYASLAERTRALCENQQRGAVSEVGG